MLKSSRLGDRDGCSRRRSLVSCTAAARSFPRLSDVASTFSPSTRCQCRGLELSSGPFPGLQSTIEFTSIRHGVLLAFQGALNKSSLTTCVGANNSQSSGDAASFERTLSTLTGKITRAAARNDNLRLRSRRVRVMWTLYAGFAYILAALLLTLVTGWKNWGATEISVVAGGPVL